MVSMLFAWNPHSVPCFMATAVLMISGFLIHRWERGSRISRYFLAFSLLFASWTLARGLLRLLMDDATALLLCRYFLAAIALGLAPLLGFILLVLGVRQSYRRLLRFNWTAGIVLAVLAVGSPSVVASVRMLPWGFEPEYGPLGFTLFGWIVVLCGITARESWRAWRRRPHGAARRRLALFSLALAGLYVAGGDLLVGAGLDFYPFGMLGVVAFTLISAYITWSVGLNEVTAQFAATGIADMVRGALLILDSEGAVQFVNERTARIMGLAAPPPAGVPLAALLGEAAAPASLATLAALGGDSEREIVHATAQGARHLGLAASALRDGHGRITAFVCVLREIADPHRDPAQQTRRVAELREAVARRELAVHYQPVVTLTTGRIAGFEALVRWPHPLHGLLPPGRFLDLAAGAGLMAALDDGVLERVCADLPRLRACAPHVWVSVNQSADALGRGFMGARLARLLAQHRLPPDALQLELLESTVLTPAVLATLIEVNALGVGIGIDDFGTGYSSLSRLHEVPVRAIKIDRAFVRAMNSAHGGRLVRAIVTFAASLGLDVVAEGVTDAAQADLLRELGCVRAQGYLYSPAVPLDAACAMLEAVPAKVAASPALVKPDSEPAIS